MKCNFLKTQSRMKLHCMMKLIIYMYHKKMKYNLFTVKYLLSCSISVVLTVKVEGLIEPPLAQMASTKACYKLGLICKKTYSLQAHLSRHIKIVHDKIKEFMCDTCEKFFSLELNLKQHIKLVHEKIKGFKCNMCEKSYYSKQVLNRHIKSIHEKISNTVQWFEPANLGFEGGNLTTELRSFAYQNS